MTFVRMYAASARLLAVTLYALVLFASAAAPAAAQIEVEADPLAYVLSGYSGHVAYVFDPARVSVGVFGVDVPEFFHGNEGWASTSRGMTVKIDYLVPSLGGFFAGLDGGIQWARFTLAGETERRRLVGAGVRTGYRYFIGRTDFYAVPWVSVSYLFDANDVVIDGQTFEQSHIQVFPTVHLGWRF